VDGARLVSRLRQGTAAQLPRQPGGRGPPDQLVTRL